MLAGVTPVYLQRPNVLITLFVLKLGSLKTERNFPEKTPFETVIYFTSEQEGEHTNYDLLMFFAAGQPDGGEMRD